MFVAFVELIVEIIDLDLKTYFSRLKFIIKVPGWCTYSSRMPPTGFLSSSIQVTGNMAISSSGNDDERIWLVFLFC